MAGAVLITACRKNREKEAFISVNKTELSGPATTYYDTLLVSSNTSWQLEKPAGGDWLQADTREGGPGQSRVILLVTANTTADVRTLRLAFKEFQTGRELQVVRLTQSKASLKVTAFTSHAKGDETIVITGAGFSAVKASNIVTINGKAATVTQAAFDKLEVTMPQRAGDGKLTISIGEQFYTSTTDITYDWIAEVSMILGGPGAASFNKIKDVEMDEQGNVYVVDGNEIKKISADGTVLWIAGSEDAGNQNGNGAGASFNDPDGIAVDKQGNVYVADLANHLIRKIDVNGNVTTLAGKEIGNSDGTGEAARFAHPADVAIDEQGNVYVAEFGNNHIRIVSPAGVVTTLSKNGTPVAVPSAYRLALGKNGEVFVSSINGHKVFKVDGNKEVILVAGKDMGGYEEGTIDQARFKNPSGIAVDEQGTLFIADQNNHRIRKISTAQVVSTLAGSGIADFANGVGTEAAFNIPVGLMLTKDHLLLVADAQNLAIRKVVLK